MRRQRIYLERKQLDKHTSAPSAASIFFHTLANSAFSVSQETHRFIAQMRQHASGLAASGVATRRFQR